MDYFLIKVTVRVKKQIGRQYMHYALSSDIHGAMKKDTHLQLIHELPTFPFYTFSGLYPVDDSVKRFGYQEGRTFSFDMRCLEQETASRFRRAFINYEGERIEVINVVATPMASEPIRELYTLTPVIAVFTEQGEKPRHWTKDTHTLEQLVERIHHNTKRKYETYMQESMTDLHPFIKEIKQLSPIISHVYKNGGKLLTNKFQLTVHSDPISQRLATFVLGAGLLEKNSLGLGYCLARS